VLAIEFSADDARLLTTDAQGAIDVWSVAAFSMSSQSLVDIACRTLGSPLADRFRTVEISTDVVLQSEWTGVARRICQ
jgi:hypothetical protein